LASEGIEVLVTGRKGRGTQEGAGEREKRGFDRRE